MASQTTKNEASVLPTPTQLSASSQPEAVQPSSSNGDWDSERRLTSALWNLQQLDFQIHQLRDLVPERIMGPLKPIIDRSPENRDSPKSPHELFEQLSRAAREGFAEIDEFKSAWNGPETQAIWNRVEERMNERGGEYPPISTVWDENYDMVLQQLDRAEQQQKIAKKRAEEESEMNRQATTEGGWQGILESFKARGLPGISAQVLPPSHDGSARFSIQLHSISTILYLQSIRDPALRDMESWHISLDNRQTPSMLAQEIVACLSDRDRKWDLPYLLDMISSYSDIKRSQCVKCNKLIDTTAQLPTIRKPKPLDTTDATGKFIWEPYHMSCV